MKRVIPLTVVVFCALVAPGNVAGRDSLGERAGQLLTNVIEHYRNGELESAWESYRAFFDDPSNRNVDANAFGLCFYRQECPALGALAFILGKPEEEAGGFRSFCPDWEDVLDTGGLGSDERTEARRTMKGFRDAALGGSCEEWVARNAEMFHTHSLDRRLAPQVVPLLSSSPGDPRPFSDVEIIGTRVTGLLDTGSTMSALNHRWADRRSGSVELIRDAPVKYLYYEGKGTLGRINRLSLGKAVFSHPVVVFTDKYLLDSGELAPADVGNLIGMNLLLQYEKVCFDWEGKKLHLGELGPCENGVKPYRNWLTGAQGVAVGVRVNSNDYVEAKIDTGSAKTYCSQWFMGQRAEREVFSFGSNNALTGDCTYDPDVLFDNSERGEQSTSDDILLGMDTLSRFAAFGWQLNPLRVYFVPKSPVSDRSVSQHRR